MKVTVCKLPGREPALEEAWEGLVEHVGVHRPDLVLLPEMPFHRWLPADPEPDADAWRAAAESHRRWIGRLGELDGAAVAASRPVARGGERRNEGFVWTPADGARSVHDKRFLPDEEGFREASWYGPGPDRFDTVDVSGVRAGFLICTELWFADRARDYARAGSHLLLTPRATPAYSRDKWLAAGRTAAVVAGAFGLSSNRAGPGPAGGFDWAGRGWVVDPDGEVLGATSTGEPFLTVEIDPAEAEAAKSTYPRYVDG